jgi:hypothetical protein
MATGFRGRVIGSARLSHRRVPLAKRSREIHVARD